MGSVTVPRDVFVKVLEDVEVFVQDVSALLDLDAVARRRRAEVRRSPSRGLPETELDAYLHRRL